MVIYSGGSLDANHGHPSSINKWANQALKNKAKPPLRILNISALDYFNIDMKMKIMCFPIRTCHFLFGRFFFTPVFLMECEIKMNIHVFFGIPGLQLVV